MDWKTNEFFKFIDRKIVNLMQLHPFIGEGITGQKYEIGEFYRTHPDYFIDSDLETYCTWMGQRTWTTMLYLNDVEKGGETQFPNINIKMKPKEGTLIAWNNLNIDGTNNENTLHEALPPESGKKYVITKLKKYIASQISFAREKGYVETLLGRRRYLKDINSRNSIVRGGAERNAINAPIQGSAADIIKISMINIQSKFNDSKFKSKMLLQVHDELVFDVFKPELNDVITLVKHEMENAFTLKVPLTVDIDYGENWLEAH